MPSLSKKIFFDHEGFLLLDMLGESRIPDEHANVSKMACICS